ncbi:hypothetical protein GcM3_220006 [Golovinomyces cichoracearum]|uniref:Uncharacterized protein n=1 Tax=Golovinomyces cichoracearum TaxID=62708 RepID=A0A420H6Z7_9PEZI|nr:hypothetical protein GcM3_220006 [Golovinomyces cichoracearum]
MAMSGSKNNQDALLLDIDTNSGDEENFSPSLSILNLPNHPSTTLSANIENIYSMIQAYEAHISVHF